MDNRRTLSHRGGWVEETHVETSPPPTFRSRGGWSEGPRGGGRSSHGRRGRRGSAGGRHIDSTNHNTEQLNSNAYKRQGDDAFETLSREVGDLVMSADGNAPERLKVLLAMTHERHPDRLRDVLDSTTTLTLNGTVLAAACAIGRAEQAEILLRYGVDPNQITASGSTALNIACYGGHAKCVRLLVGLPHSLGGPMLVPGKPLPVAASARICVPSGGVHALVDACRGNNELAAVEIVEVLVGIDRDLLLTPAVGWIALHAAAKNGFPRVVETLLKLSTPPGSENSETGDEVRHSQLHFRNVEGLSPLQVAEKRCESDMQREKEEQQAASNRSRSHGGVGGVGGGNHRRGPSSGRGGSRGGRGGGRHRGGGGGAGGRSNAGRGRGRGRFQAQPVASDGTRSESGESRDGERGAPELTPSLLEDATAGERGVEREAGEAQEIGEQGGEGSSEEALKGGWGCVVALADAAGIMSTLHGGSSLRNDTVRDRYLAHVGLHQLIQDVRDRTDVAAQDGNTEPDDDLMDYMLLLTAHVSAMYKAIIKPARNTNGWQQASSSRLLAELMRPRDGRPHVLNDETSIALVEILCNTNANPHVLRPIVLMLVEIATTPPKVPVAPGLSKEGEALASAGEGGATSPWATAVIVECQEGNTSGNGVRAQGSGGFNPSECCLLRRHRPLGLRTADDAADTISEGRALEPLPSPPSTTSPAFHCQACVRVWSVLLRCIGRLGKMLLYGLQGQQEGDHGEVLYEREGALFDTLWELILRFLLPHAKDAARYLDTPLAEGQSPTRAILSQVAAPLFDKLWEGLGEALEVIEGGVSGNEPDRFGALLRGYLVYLHLMDERVEHYNDLVKVVKDGRVETGLAGGGGGHGGRRGGRGPGRNPKSILTVVAAEVSLGIPPQFRELVVKHVDPLSEIVDADPAVLENRLAVLLRIEGAVDTPQKLEYIVTVLESRSSRSKGLELSINRMANPEETVEMAMQQLAAAPPRAMGQNVDLKFVNEAGEGDGPMRELIDMMSVVFRPQRSTDDHRGPDDALTPAQSGAARASRKGESATTKSPTPASAGRPSAKLNPMASPFAAPGVSSMFGQAAQKSGYNRGGGGGGFLERSAVSVDGAGSSGALLPGAQTSDLPPASRSARGKGQASSPSSSPSQANGFWKCFPLFRVYVPDPAAVVPREEGLGRATAAMEKEEVESRLRFFRAAGRLIALSLISATPLGVVLPDALWAVLLGMTPTWEEYCGRDMEYLKSMGKVLKHKFGPGEDGNGLELFFSVSERGSDGKVLEVPLLVGGETKRVTDKNKNEFVNLATRRHGLGGADQAIAAMRSGIGDVIPKNLLSALLPFEVATIVSGPQGNVDLVSLKANVWYVDSDFNAQHRVVRWLWEWADSLNEESKRRLLLFWSGSSRMPPFGFEDDALNEDHRWAIARGPVEDACPQVSTCDRRMTLPEYSSREAAFKLMSATLEHGYLGYTKA